MNMMDWFQALTRGQDPNSAIVPSAFDARSPSESAIMDPNLPGSAMAPPSGGAPNARMGLLPPVPQGPPQGVPSPVTNPKPPQETPKAYESPPDLANMYLQMMQQNQNAAALDRNLSLIAAGFSKYPEARAALMHRAGGGGAAAGQMTAADFVNIQKIQQNQKDQLLWSAAKRGLMKQYELSQEEVDALGPEKMGEIIKHHNTQNLVQVTDTNGQTHFADGSTGKIITTVGSKKPIEGQFVTGPQGPELRSKETGARIGEPVGAAPEEGEFVDTPEGRRLMSKRTGQPMGPAAGRLPEKDELEFADINKGRIAAGKPEMTREEYVKLKKGGVTVNVGPTGTPFPEPEKGHAYVRNEDGSVKVDAEGKPMQYKLPGGTVQEEAKKLGEKETASRIQSHITSSNVGQAISTALAEVDKPGVVGYGAEHARTLAKVAGGGTPADRFDAAMDTIKANISFDALKQMRLSSPTGAALGPVSDFENKLLQSTIGPISRYTDAKSVKETLARVRAGLEILSGNKFNEGDEGKFQEMYNKRLNEIRAETATKKGVKVQWE